MYVPASFRVSEPERLRAFVERYPFAMLLGHDGELPVTTSVPVLWRPDGEQGSLVTHLAKANEHWRLCDGQRRSVIQFAGPHAYISPRWYATQPAVPTWNYATVQAIGRPLAVEDPDWLRGLLSDLMARFDPEYDLPDELTERLLPAIVGVEMPVEAWHGKYKLSQNRTAEDQCGAIAGLLEGGETEALMMAEFMRAESGL